MNIREITRIPLEYCKLCVVQHPILVSVVNFKDKWGRKVLRDVLDWRDEAVSVTVKAMECHLLYALVS